MPVDDDEVGAALMREPVIEGVQCPLIDSAPWAAYHRGMFRLVRRGTRHVDVRAADAIKRIHRLHCLVNLVVEIGVGLGVPALILLVKKTFELVPHHKVSYIRVATR